MAIKFFENFALFCGKIAASYRLYWERENKRAQEEYKQLQDQNKINSLLTLYDMYGKVIAQANNNVCDLCDLYPVKNITQITVSRPDNIKKYNENLFLMCFRSKKQNGSVVPAKILCQHLQEEADSICDHWNIERIKIRINYDSNNRIKIEAALNSDVIAAMNKEIKI